MGSKLTSRGWCGGHLIFLVTCATYKSLGTPRDSQAGLCMWHSMEYEIPPKKQSCLKCPASYNSIWSSVIWQKLLWWWKHCHCPVQLPGGSAGKESACHVGDPSPIPGSGRSAGEGIGYPLQYSWASLVAQLVKNLPAMRETWVQSLGWEDPLEKGKATHSSILAWRIPWTV